MLNKDQITKADDLTKEKVMVPEWRAEGQAEKDAFVFVRCLTGTERDKFESEVILSRGKNTEVNMKNLRARLLVCTIVDDKGIRLFSDKDIDIIGAKNGAVVDRLFSIAQKLSGMTKEDMEDLTKNSDATHSEDSVTD